MRHIDERKQHPEIAIVPTLSGVLAGGIVGAVGGPPGVAVGATIGGIVGALAGETLTDAIQEATVHDESLDEAIGVSSGDLGAKEVAASSFVTFDAAERQHDELLLEYDEIERALAAFRDAFREGDPPSLVAPFRDMEARVRSCLAREEAAALPALATTHPHEMDQLLAEHERIREALVDIAVAIELHAARPRDIDVLSERISSHHRHERAVFSGR